MRRWRPGLLAIVVVGTGACFDVDAYCFRDECTFGGQGGTSSFGGSGGDPAGGDGGAPTGGSGGGPVESDCLNGLDDDEDGDVDCADEDCQPDYECVPTPLRDWSNLLYFAEATYDPVDIESMPCPDGSQSATFFAGPSTTECTPCDCSFSGASCSAPLLEWNKAPCNSSWISLGRATTFGCDDVSTSGSGPEHYRVNGLPDLLDDGTCTTAGGVLTNPLPWATTVQLCEAEAGGGCGAEAQCARKPPEAFEPLYCIKQVGEVSCPPGWLNRDLDIYGDAEDTRSCDGCACTPPVACEGGKYTINAGAGCLPPPGTGTSVDIVDATCVDVANIAYLGDWEISIHPEAGTPVGAACTQAVASGDIALTESEKVCCRGGGL